MKDNIYGYGVINCEYDVTVFLGVPVAYKISVGQALRVFYSFRYRMAVTTVVPIWASLYRYTAGILDRSTNAQNKSTITLEKSLDWKLYQGQIDITVGSVNAGLWGLIVELPNFKNAEARIDNCIEVAAVPIPTFSEFGIAVFSKV